MESLFLALDFEDKHQARTFLHNHQLTGVPVKVGMELYYKEGPSLLYELKEAGHPIFLDLKLYDIPTTVYRTMRNMGSLALDFVNVHATGGSTMIRAAKEGLQDGGADQTKLLAVTVLTSFEEETMQREWRVTDSLHELVGHYARLGQENGADGVVCSPHEAMSIQKECGEDFYRMTPGIRLRTDEQEDQKRTATPSLAREMGASGIVVGRSVTRSTTPEATYERLKKEWERHVNETTVS
ncbi:orotidine 5'-phosphate decarboxylase [Pontibacillus halophilus JSM 076056 = DSM 19796]|uniref:Orotidine 5'-phosphate decarboxylase n=1 Tax=Pontibacillus halophilus JSM 076056 = DSM 19796 TaxID=1385510 RepID=A0A0A5GPQ3_9BACI|nr:orotidine-5'-phosphate decarboxylase [Pontibacillus halophilus]KGX93233.1 orotidine 5'-phosphate decarboxylase [Pontibacillus halophilus JSM 076056 = DSM 19796]